MLQLWQMLKLLTPFTGITPTLPPSIISPAGSSPGFRARTLNAVASNQDKEIDRLQRYEFFGFTSRELVDHGMFPDLNAKRADEVVGPILYVSILTQVLILMITLIGIYSRSTTSGNHSISPLQLELGFHSLDQMKHLGMIIFPKT